MGRPSIDITGQTFGGLIAVSFYSKDRNGNHHKWLVRCVCGNEFVINKNRLMNGETFTCGCISTIRRARPVNHGHSIKGFVTSEYRSWCAMRARCLKENHPSYKDYGGRGITVCQEWMDFEVFLKDMGRKPSPKYSIDRINNDGNYEPSNCRWATAKQQANNRKRNKVESDIEYYI